MSVGAGAAQLFVPIGTPHDLWANVRTVPRLLQAAPGGNFDVLVKFGTGVSATTQQQGIVVEQSHDKLLRFETYSDGGRTFLFVAAIDGGSADVLSHELVQGGSPVYLRLYHVNDYFTLAYSTDGVAWRSRSFHRPFGVTALGPYVGNGGQTPPAFQGRIDYFRVGDGNTPPPVGL
jgi:hypothetical protein